MFVLRGSKMKTIRVAPAPENVPKSGAVDSEDSDIRTQVTITLDISGTIFTIAQNKLARFPGTRLGRLDKSDPSYNPENKRFCFDRNAFVFHFILDFYRHGKLHFPRDFCGLMIKQELEYWQIDEKHIAKCCWNNYIESEEDLLALTSIEESFESDPQTDLSPEKMGLRYRIWLFLEYPKSSKAALIWSYFLLFIIVVAVISFSLESVGMFRRLAGPYAHLNVSSFTTKIEYLHATNPLPIMMYIELFTAVIFTLELTARFAVCNEKRAFVRSFMNWIDFISVTVMLVHFVFSFFSHLIPATIEGIIMSGMWLGRVIRIIRVFKFARNNDGLRVLLLGLRASVEEIFLVTLVMVICVLFFAPLIYLTELENEFFPNIPAGWWWAIITMTTVGYGDVYPVSMGGCIVGSMCAVSGLIVLGLTVPIIANNFNTYYRYLQKRNLRKGMR